MINLEWLRSFRAVYKLKSLSLAADQLLVSQPTVSQHISALESRIGKKLFVRKSKGVVETDMGRILNTMVSGSLEELALIEEKVIKKDAKFKNILSIGISQHLYKSVLCGTLSKLGEYVHVKFDKKDDLIKQVESGDLLYAVIPEKVERFDVNCYPLTAQNIVLVATPDIDLTEFEQVYETDKRAAEVWLKKYRWFAHDHNSTFIKFYWMQMFDKKRPSVVPNYVIPNEFEVLYQQSNGSGLSVAFDTVARFFEEKGCVRISDIHNIQFRQLHLIANTKKTDAKMNEKMVSILRNAQHHSMDIISSS